MKPITERTTAALAWIDSELVKCDGATKWPWNNSNCDLFTNSYPAQHILHVDSSNYNMATNRANSRFIASARTGYPAMLEVARDTLESLRHKNNHTADSTIMRILTIIEQCQTK